MRGALVALAVWWLAVVGFSARWMATSDRTRRARLRRAMDAMRRV